MTRSEAVEYYKENKFSTQGSVIILCFVTAMLIWHGVAWSLFSLAVGLTVRLFIETVVNDEKRL